LDFLVSLLGGEDELFDGGDEVSFDVDHAVAVGVQLGAALFQEVIVVLD
jgi:hypothetical protein